MARHGGLITQKSTKKTAKTRAGGPMGVTGNKNVGSLRMPKGMKEMGVAGSSRAK